MPIAHVEAGLRSFDRSMPERSTAYSQMPWLITCSQRNQTLSRISCGGASPTLHTSCRKCHDRCSSAFSSPLARKSRIGYELGASSMRKVVGPFAALTLHRPSNVDSPMILRTLASGDDQLLPTCCRWSFPFIHVARTSCVGSGTGIIRIPVCWHPWGISTSFACCPMRRLY